MTHGDAREGKWRRKLANGVGSQYSSHYLGTWCIQHYYRLCAHLGCQQSTELTPTTAALNGLVRFARKTKSGFCACVITFHTQSTVHQDVTVIGCPVCRRSAPAQDDGNRRHRLPVSITRCISWATVSAGTAQTTRSSGRPSPSVRTAARGRTFTSGI